MEIDMILEFMKDHGGWLITLIIAVIGGLYAMCKNKSNKDVMFKQNGGKNSANYQANGDIHININNDDKR